MTATLRAYRSRVAALRPDAWELGVAPWPVGHAKQHRSCEQHRAHEQAQQGVRQGQEHDRDPKEDQVLPPGESGTRDPAP